MMYYSEMTRALLINLVRSKVDFSDVVLFSPIAIFCLFHFVLLGVVIYQLVVRQKNRAQVIGKGVLAEIVWLVPTLVVLFIIAGYIMRFLDGRSDNSPLAMLVITATSVCYGLAGWGLFRWVASPHNEALGMWERQSWRNY